MNMDNLSVGKVWNSLPLKKRPIKDCMDNDMDVHDHPPCKIKQLHHDSISHSHRYHGLTATPSATPFKLYGINYVNHHINHPIMKKPYSRSCSPNHSEYSFNSIASSYESLVDSPLDLSSPCSSRASTSPNVFLYDHETVSAYASQSDITIHCLECHKPFSNRIRYRAHLRRHASKRSGKYRCFVCTKTFVQRSSLTTHLRIHTGEKPFKCYECNDSFGDFSTFTKHKRIHSGEKPYSCPRCNRAFSQSGNMHRHLKALHGQDPIA